ncbi:MAG: YqgE/AlgH family protein [Flavobacteriia bacterium]|nr:YqgE/AlgH family protein [Flavobacteriia bacterium]
MHPNLDYMEKPMSGSILIAEPFLGDPNFDRSVVLLTEHGDEGTVGYVLNRPLDVKIQGLLPDFPEFESRIYNGGPVEQSNLYFLHNRPDLFEGAIQVSETVFWGGDFDRLREVASLGILNPDEIRFFLGYSGWGRGQLESELEEQSWMVLPPTAIDIFHSNPEEMWKDVIARQGGDYQLWANAPSDPLLN